MPDMAVHGGPGAHNHRGRKGRPCQVQSRAAAPPLKPSAMIMQEAGSEPSSSKCKNSQLHMLYLCREPQLGGRPQYTGPGPASWGGPRDVFCRSGNSQGFPSPRAQKNQSKVSGVVDRTVLRPTLGRGTMLGSAVGHRAGVLPLWVAD